MLNNLVLNLNLPVSRLSDNILLKSLMGTTKYLLQLKYSNAETFLKIIVRG